MQGTKHQIVINFSFVLYAVFFKKHDDKADKRSTFPLDIFI